MKKTLLLSVFAFAVYTSFGQVTSSSNEPVSEVTRAEFPGGNLDLMMFISENLQFPEAAKDRKIDGKCVLRIMVTDQGELKNVEVIQPVENCPECDQEAIRLVQSMPNWEPATKDGKAVRSHINLPITFKN